ncbi:MAG: hypothetical protein K2O16_17235 [Lachnospiraceae bacterium]|nr:hypothetical protein [Lachnospiraceae bacterium]
MGTIIRSGTVVLGILLIRRLAMGKITRKLQYFIWIILPVTLLVSSHFSIPVTLPFSAASLGNVLIKKWDVTQAPVSTYGNENAWHNIFLPDTAKDNFANAEWDIEKENSHLQTGSLQNNRSLQASIWKAIKYSITCLLIAFYMGSNLKFALQLRKRRHFLKVDGETSLAIYLLADCCSPFLFGKGVYLHPEMTKNAVSMRYMILHEYCHLKQGDLLWNIVKYCFCAAYWFNPFIWLAVYFINRDCELACDEAVISMIGFDRRQEYGMTLLELMREKNRKRNFTIEPFMKGKKSMMKERILFLSKPFHKNQPAALCVLAGALLLTGYSLATPETPSMQKENQTPIRFLLNVENPAAPHIGLGDPEADAENHQTPTHSASQLIDSDTPAQAGPEALENHYYNSVKKNGSEIYFYQSGFLCSMNLKTKIVRQLEEGNFRLGNIEGNYLYYLKYPWDSAEDAGIGRLNLTTLERQILIPWEEKYLLCDEIYVKDDCLYVGVERGCEVFSVNSSTAQKLDTSQNQILNILRQFEKLTAESPHINSGYLHSIFRFHTFTLVDNNSHILYICDAQTGQAVKKENCLGNILISDKGIVYTAMDGNVYLSPLGNLDKDKLLFSASENGYSINYGTYDGKGLYVFRENGNSVECKCLLWEGGMTDIMEFYDIRLAIDLRFNAFGDFKAYFMNEEINLI